MKLLQEEDLREALRKAWNHGYMVAQQTYASGGVAEDPTAMNDDVEREQHIDETMERV